MGRNVLMMTRERVRRKTMRWSRRRMIRRARKVMINDDDDDEGKEGVVMEKARGRS